MTIITFKPTNQQETNVVHNYLRNLDYTQTEFKRPVTFLHDVRIHHIDYQVVVDTTTKRFEWNSIQNIAWANIDYQCATITKLVRFVDPQGWDCTANAMDVMEEGFAIINAPDEEILPC